MEGYDVLMIVVLVAATVFGVWKGMAWQIASIASLSLSYAAALNFSKQLAPLVGKEEPWNRFLAMLLIYLATSLAIWLAFRVISGFMDRLKLREWDRQIGGLFGLAKGVLLCVAITLFAVSLVGEQRRQTILHSRSGYYIAWLLHRSDAVMPAEIHEIVGPYIHTAQQHLDADRDSAHGEPLVEEKAKELLWQAVRPSDAKPLDR